MRGMDSWGEGKIFLKEKQSKQLQLNLTLTLARPTYGRNPCCLGKWHLLLVKIKRTLKTVDGCFYSSELTINSGLAWPLRVVSTDRQTQTVRPGCRPCVCVSGCTPASAGAILIQERKHWIIQHKLKLLGCLVLSGSNLFGGSDVLPMFLCKDEHQMR